MKSILLSLSLVGLFSSVAHAGAGEVTRALHRYNVEDAQLAATEGMLPAPRLIQHWKQLGDIKKELERVHASALGENERVLLRHELSELLGTAVDVAQVKGDYVEEKVKEAGDARKEAMLAIAEWANQHLDFDVEEVLGVRLDGEPTVSTR